MTMPAFRALPPRILAKGLAMIVLLVLAGWAMQKLGVGRMLDTGWVDTAVKGRGAEGAALFLAIGGAAMAIGLPRQIVCFLAGYAGGLGYGTVLALAASLLGCALAFFTARLLGREVVSRWLPGRMRQIDGFLGRNPFTTTVLIRFLPVGNNLLTNLVAGVSAVRPLPFLAGSVVGYVPQTIVFVLLGSGVAVEPVARIGLSVALFLASALLGVALFRRMPRPEAGEPGS